MRGERKPDTDHPAAQVARRTGRNVISARLHGP
jgi:hypothetical protein